MRSALVTFVACCLIMLPGCESEQSDGKSTKSLQAGGTVTDSSSSLAMPASEMLRDSLRSKGMYECCTKPECLECAEKLGLCDCYNDIGRKDPICGECLRGFKRGEGRLKLVSIPELEKIREQKRR